MPEKMSLAYMCLDGLAIEIEYAHPEVAELLNFLMADMPTYQPELHRVVGRCVFQKQNDNWQLISDQGRSTITTVLLEDLALPLLNHTMSDLAEANLRSVSLHAGLVSDSRGSILLPGASGSGKTNACLWLTHLGLRYHSDEMVTIDRASGALHALTRPFTLRVEALKRLRKIIDLPSGRGEPGLRTLESAGNAWIDHRLINPRYEPIIPPLRAIVFPVYTTGEVSEFREISSAHAGMELMRCHFQSQSFADHGFTTISALVRRLPVYIAVYPNFDRLGVMMAGFTDFS